MRKSSFFLCVIDEFSSKQIKSESWPRKKERRKTQVNENNQETEQPRLNKEIEEEKPSRRKMYLLRLQEKYRQSTKERSAPRERIGRKSQRATVKQ